MSLENVSREKLLRLASGLKRLRVLEEAESLEESLTDFLAAGWRYIDPNPFVPGWHLDAISEHLEAVIAGDIRRLIINVPPRSSKSSIVSVAWPAWVWAQQNLPDMPLMGAKVQFLFASYAQSLSMRDSVKCRRLIMSPWYQERWKGRFSLTGDQNAKIRFDNDHGGYRLATSVDGALTGEGGSILAIDDPHNAVEVESDAMRQRAIDWWDTSMSTRLNDPKTGAVVVIMQRLDERDLTAHLLNQGGWEHLMLPMEFEEGRACVTSIGWEDPRTEEGELLCYQRFGDNEVDQLKRDLGAWRAAGQLQQRPEPKGGGIFKRDWWQQWTDVGARQNGVNPGHLPPMSYVLGILDTAYTEKEENDPCAMIILGLWTDAKGNPQIMLKYAWEEWLEFNPLVEKVAQSAKDHQIDRLLIEAKASGISVAQELRRRYSRAGFAIEQVDPGKGDKVARAYAVTHVFEDGAVWAPGFEDGTWRAWAEKVIDQCVAKGTLVITGDGVIPIEDICLGDMVLTHKGRFRMVTAKSEREAQETVILEPKSLDPLTVTPEHPIYCLELDSVRNVIGDGPNWVAAGETIAREYRDVTREERQFSEAYPSPCHAMTLPLINRDNPIDRIDFRGWVLPSRQHEFMSDDIFMATSSHKIQAMKWDCALTYEFGRVCGLYLAEGSCSGTNRICWSFHQKETQFIGEISAFVNETLGARISTFTSHNCTIVHTTMPLLIGFFSEFGRGAENKRIPQWMWDAPDEFIRGTIDGYFDGDGYLNPNNMLVGTTVSPSLAWGMRLLCLRVGRFATVRSGKEAREFFIRGRKTNGKKSYVVSYCKERQNNGVAIEHEDVVGYSIMHKKMSGAATVYNLSVGEDNSYCTTSGIVHNCAIFPKAAHDDLTDCIVHGLKYLRDAGLLLRSEEQRRRIAEEMEYRKPVGLPYQV